MLERNPHSVTYDELHTLCVRIFREPRVNIQRGKNGEATPYRVKQVLAAIKKVEEQS